MQTKNITMTEKPTETVSNNTSVPNSTDLIQNTDQDLDITDIFKSLDIKQYENTIKKIYNKPDSTPLQNIAISFVAPFVALAIYSKTLLPLFFLLSVVGLVLLNTNLRNKLNEILRKTELNDNPSIYKTIGMSAESTGIFLALYSGRVAPLLVGLVTGFVLLLVSTKFKPSNGLITSFKISSMTNKIRHQISFLNIDKNNPEIKRAFKSYLKTELSLSEENAEYLTYRIFK